MELNNNLTWREAIIEVLKASSTAMHYTDIAAEILKLGLRKEVGATPAATVGANIYSSLKREKENSPFEKTDQPGVFKLNHQTSGIAPPTILTSDAMDEKEGDKELQKDAGIIRALGMFWRRDFVALERLPKNMGQMVARGKSGQSGRHCGLFRSAWGLYFA